MPEAAIPDDLIGFSRPARREPRPHDYLLLPDEKRKDAPRKEQEQEQKHEDDGRDHGAATPASDPAAKRKGRRRRLLIFGVLGFLLLVAAIAFGIYWFTTLRWFESTDDAYTQADNVVIAPHVAGYVAELLVTDNQRVKAGDVLLRIDPRPYKAALDQAVANQQKDEANLANAQRNLARDAAIVQNNLAVTQQQFDNDKATVAADQAAVASDAAQVEAARLNLEYTVVKAPVDGAVGDRSVQLGAYVQPAQGLMTIVPMGHAIYVVANFKETQIERMFRGEKVALAIDTFPGVAFTGTVDSLAPGSGAQFALLPPENATGNFTKIVQRVPVKILIDDPPAERLDQLRPGLSVEADVDLRTAPPEGQRQTLVLSRAAAPGT